MTSEPRVARSPGRRESGITIAALRAFAAVVECGGFSAAAAALGMTQPSVSAQVQSLEEICDVRLLHRRGRLELTEDGRALLVRARLALARVDEFERAVGDIRELRSGRLVLGFSTPYFALPLLAAFAAAHPAVALATRIGNSASLLADVTECRVDVAVMTLVEPPAAYASEIVAPQRLGVCVPLGHPLAARRSLAIGDVAAGRLVVREAGSMTRALFEQGGGGDGGAPRLEVGSREALKEAVAAGFGPGILLDGEAGDDPRLAFVPFTAPRIGAVVCAVALREMRDVPSVSAFLAIAAEAGAAASGQAAGRRQAAT